MQRRDVTFRPRRRYRQLSRMWHSATPRPCRTQARRRAFSQPRDTCLGLGTAGQDSAAKAPRTPRPSHSLRAGVGRGVDCHLATGKNRLVSRLQSWFLGDRVRSFGNDWRASLDGPHATSTVVGGCAAYDWARAMFGMRCASAVGISRVGALSIVQIRTDTGGVRRCTTASCRTARRPSCPIDRRHPSIGRRETRSPAFRPWR